jgi:hypothetical protein
MRHPHQEIQPMEKLKLARAYNPSVRIDQALLPLHLVSETISSFLLIFSNIDNVGYGNP